MKDRHNDYPVKIRRFLLLAFGLSWILWIPAVLMEQAEFQPVKFVLFIIGGFGPTIAGILSIRCDRDLAAEQDIFKKLTGVRLISRSWYVFIVLAFPLLAVLAIAIYRTAYGAMPYLPSLEGFDLNAGNIITLVMIMIQSIVLGPLSEEIGWRGYLLDKLQNRYGVLAASLILGLLWGMWHFPLFFFEGSMYHEWGAGTMLFWLFLLRMTALTVIMTVVYYANNRSLLSAILLHFMFNFTFIFLQPAPLEIHRDGTILLVLLAGSLFVGFRKRPENQFES